MRYMDFWICSILLITSTLLINANISDARATKVSQPNQQVPEGFDPLDSLSPRTSKDDAQALPLQTVTLSTADIEQIKLFYVDGMGMKLAGPIDVSKKTKKNQRALWDIPSSIDWAEYHLTRPGVLVHNRPAMSIRVLLLDTPTPNVHQSWDARELGGFSIGFPNLNQTSLDTRIRRLGFGALNVIEKYNVPRTDGTEYEIHETIFNGPDFVHAVGIERLAMAPLGAVDKKSKLGGPGYSAQAITNSDKILSFYTDVLGMELRRDFVWKSAGQDGAMSLPNGTEFRFSIIFAKGYGSGGHLLFVDFSDENTITTNVEPRVPNRGIGMWSFPVRNIDDILANAEKFGSKVIHKPVKLEDPLHGDIRVATLLAPNNFLIEVYEVE